LLQESPETTCVCTDIRNLLHQLGEKEYDPSTLRIFIDSSKRSLQAVLLHNSNVLASLPLAHSTKLSESYETLKLVLEKIKYHEREWQICGDLKVTGLLLGQQRGYTNFRCFLCEWDSRARDKHGMRNFLLKERNLRMKLAKF
jgi:hypothetical protein